MLFFGQSLYLLHQETTFLEACIENHTKANLFMDQVDFEPAKQWSAVRLQNEDHHSTLDPPTRSVRFSKNRYHGYLLCQILYFADPYLSAHQ